MYEGGYDDASAAAVTSAADTTNQAISENGMDDDMADPRNVLYDFDTFNAADHKSLSVGVRFRPIIDWRIRHKDSFCAALTAGDLRPTDYSILGSAAWAVFLWLLLMITLLVVTKGPLGAILCLPISYLMTTFAVTYAAVG